MSGSRCSPLKIQNTLALQKRLRTSVNDAGFKLDVHLSRRERQVLVRVAKGFQASEIAHDLDISAHTVNQCIKACYRKLALNNRADATRAAIALGL